MTLDQLSVGGSAAVVALAGDPLLRERLAELGFTPGTDVQMIRKAPLGDPLHVRVRSGAFAIRADEARCIEIDPSVSSPRATS